MLILNRQSSYSSCIIMGLKRFDRCIWCDCLRDTWDCVCAMQLKRSFTRKNKIDSRGLSAHDHTLKRAQRSIATRMSQKHCSCALLTSHYPNPSPNLTQCAKHHSGFKTMWSCVVGVLLLLLLLLWRVEVCADVVFFLWNVDESHEHLKLSALARHLHGYDDEGEN